VSVGIFDNIVHAVLLGGLAMTLFALATLLLWAARRAQATSLAASEGYRSLRTLATQQADIIDAVISETKDTSALPDSLWQQLISVHGQARELTGKDKK